jgi:hypothetical protein
MTPSPDRHPDVEARFRELVAGAGLPEPDDVAHLRRVVIFLWYETKAFVLIDLDEAPDDPLDGLDLAALAADVLPPRASLN